MIAFLAEHVSISPTREELQVEVIEPEIHGLVDTMIAHFGIEKILNQFDTDDIKIYLKELDY